MKRLNRIDQMLHQLEKWICMIGFSGMVFTVLYGIVRREFLHIPFSAGEEITRNLTVIVIFFSAALAVHTQTHVGVEAFVKLIPEKYQLQVWYVQNGLSFFFYAVILILSAQVFIHYLGSGQVMPISRLPMAMMYSCVPIGAAFSVYHMVVRILNKVKEKEGLSGKEVNPSSKTSETEGMKAAVVKTFTAQQRLSKKGGV